VNGPVLVLTRRVKTDAVRPQLVRGLRGACRRVGVGCRHGVEHTFARGGAGAAGGAGR
jgi:hypothetical protein